MKTPETGAVAPVVTAKEASAPAIEALNVEIQQRLWQMLMQLQLMASGESGAAVAADVTIGGTGLGSSHERESRAESGSGELAATAYVLAGQILQFTLHPHESGAAPMQDTTATPNVAVRLDAATADGGSASVDVAHPELGEIGLQVEMSRGSVRVTAVTTSELSAQVLQQGQTMLAERLLRQGVSLEALDVVVRKRKPKKLAKRTRGSLGKQES
jgi:hypothetical protein